VINAVRNKSALNAEWMFTARTEIANTVTADAIARTSKTRPTVIGSHRDADLRKMT
jgi:hypothetical protein